MRSQSQSGDDVTRAVRLGRRLASQAARAERRSLLRRLENADVRHPGGVDPPQRLDLNASEIRGLRGQLRDLRLRTDYAR